MTVKTKKEITYYPLLKYTGLFGVPHTVSETDTDFIIDYDNEYGTVICEAIEEHNEYGMDFPVEVQQLMMLNASKEMTAELNVYIDGIAKSFRYDDMKSVRSYTGFENPFREECTTLAQWSAQCWITAGTIEAAVVAGDRPMPSMAEVLEELPECELVA